LGRPGGGFFGLEVGRSFDVAVPLCAQPLLQPQQPAIGRRSVGWLPIIGRLAPGVPLAQATAELEARETGWLVACGVVALAVLVPTWRATRLSPVRALREE
jgi:hypothetical protein